MPIITLLRWTFTDIFPLMDMNIVHWAHGNRNLHSVVVQFYMLPDTKLFSCEINHWCEYGLYHFCMVCLVHKSVFLAFSCTLKLKTL